MRDTWSFENNGSIRKRKGFSRLGIQDHPTRRRIGKENGRQGKGQWSGRRRRRGGGEEPNKILFYFIFL